MDQVPWTRYHGPDIHGPGIQRDQDTKGPFRLGLSHARYPGLKTQGGRITVITETIIDFELTE